MNWTNFHLTTREMETLLREMGIDPDDSFAVVANFDAVEKAASERAAKKMGLKAK